jgi:glycosyltransferase involved in cell wall biosynthesis
MRRLIFATQKLDSRDPILAATVPKVRALASRVDQLVVLCDSAERGVAPDNVRVHEFHAATQFQRGARFVRALAAELRPRPIGFVAHMIPLYVAIAAPVVKPLRIPIVLWYSHPDGHRLVRLADAAASSILSVDRTTFPLESRKLVAIGHGIDVDEFSCADQREEMGRLHILVLGRYSPIKGIDRIIQGAALGQERGLQVAVEAYGAAGSGVHETHKRELERLARELGVDARLHDAVPRVAVPSLLARSDVLVNATAGPSADKVVYEAAASCVPPLASSPAFADLLPEELRFDRDRPQTLADRLLQLDRRRRPDLRELVRRRHSVETWADAVLATVDSR